MNAPNPPKPIISPQKPLVYSYVRFSTAEQRKGTGQARQDSLADKWCLQEGLPLFKNYSDLGVSAFKGKNATEGALSQFLELVKAGQIKTGSILLVESLDRLSRDKINLAAELFLGIVNRGITVVTLCDGYRYAPDSFNFAQLVMSLAIFMRANDESTMKSQRKAGSWKIKRQKAKDTNSVLGGNTPRWIKVVDGKYQLIDDQVKLVRDIFQGYVDGLGMFLLNKKYGVPKPTISYWLSNPVVLGTITMMDEGKQFQIRNHYPAIISESLWAMAQRAKVERYQKRKTTGRTGFVNLFSGLMVDPRGRRFDVMKQYGFSSYVSYGAQDDAGFVLQARPLERVICLHQLGHRFVQTGYKESHDPIVSAKVKQLDRKIAEIKGALLEDTELAGDLLPILKTLRAQRDGEKSAATIVRKVMDFKFIENLLSNDIDVDSRLRMREIVRDSVDQVRILEVSGGNWYKYVKGEVDTTDGRTVSFSFAYGSRNVGYVLCEEVDYAHQDGKNAPPLIVRAKGLTPAVIEAIRTLPRRVTNEK